jgi:outer membrane receptor for Fe3+-dicitrate
LHSQLGSFAQASSYASLGYGKGRHGFTLTGEGMKTNRYLDAPTLDNFSNRASGGALGARYETRWAPGSSTRFSLAERRTGFLAPNELLQQQAGQRIDRSAAETMGHVTHTQLLSPSLILQGRAMVRDNEARLWSNALATPIAPEQDRGFREVYGGGHLSWTHGAHEFKSGGEFLRTSIREDFRYRITARELEPFDIEVFDDDVPDTFRFRQRGRGRDQSAFVQDRFRRGNFTINAGLRFDRYSLFPGAGQAQLTERAWSPRLAAAYTLPTAGLTLRASFDRAFTTPAVENILLASSNLVEALGGEGEFLPLRPSRGNYFETGLTQRLGRRLRLDASWYLRRLDNFADDSLLFNTGVSFPVAFTNARVHGLEAKLELNPWGIFSGFVSYSQMQSLAQLPGAGGLFLGDEAEELFASSVRIPLTQDQRNTVRARFRVQPHRRAWFLLHGAYNSGLPFELEGVDDGAFLRAQYGARILSKVNFERGRVRPSASLGLSAGSDLWQREALRLRVQGDFYNLGNRLNVINFSGAFSGTAIEPGRNAALRLMLAF